MPCGHLGSLGFGTWNRFLRLQLHPRFLNAPDFPHLGLACPPALWPWLSLHPLAFSAGSAEAQGRPLQACIRRSAET